MRVENKMKQRIYLNFFCLLLFSILILSSALGLLFHSATRKQELAAIRGHAQLVSDLLNSGVTGNFRFSDYISYVSDAPRMTIVAPDGTVILDSRAIADNMENHADRPEIVEAFRSGNGETVRYSDTLKVEMYYYATKLADGSVLRMSRQVGGVADVFAVILPAAAAITALVLLIANFAAHKLTRRIIAPLENIDLNSGNTAVYDELTPYSKKIEQQRQEIAEKIAALSDRANTIEAITGNMKEGLILVDGAGMVLTANASAEEILGGNIEKNNILYICREERFQLAAKQCLAGENAEVQLERNGRIHNVYLSPVCSGGIVRGAVILFQDATERNRAEKQRREFSANVSHELKTPLTTISALSEMIESGMAKDSDIKSFAARITEQSGRLLVLIDDIIRLSEFDEGGSMKENTVFDLWELSEAVIAALRDNAGNIKIELTGEQFDISADLRMIDELLYNLIDNGIKYNKDGGRVTVDLKRVESGLCRISVSDTGIGIAAQHQPHVFERFYRVDKSRSKKTGGTGLGLSIVKHIVELHGGRVELHSTEEEGTTVTCYLKYLP